MRKGIMDGYVGVKFQTQCCCDKAPPGVDRLYSLFREAGERLSEYGMAPQNGGNMSMRFGHGFVVTASGCNLGIIEPDELTYIEKCEVDNENVCYHGPIIPSSETIMHHMILAARREAGAVIHAHDPRVTREAIAADSLAETIREEPYGTVALAKIAIEAFGQNQKIIVLRNHGYVCAGPDLAEIVESIIQTHKRLLDRSSE